MYGLYMVVILATLSFYQKRKKNFRQRKFAKKLFKRMADIKDVYPVDKI